MDPAGLTAAEVAQRVAAGAVNGSPQRPARSFWDIVRANVLTRFNALLGTLCALVLIFGSPIDALFGLVIVANSAIGVIQEVRAKRALEQLDVAGRAMVSVRRDGASTMIDPAELVRDDVVLLGSGDALAVDGNVVDAAGLELDESLLTGEADPVAKGPGDAVLSGSFVAAGSGSYRVTTVGSQAYAARLVGEVSRFSLAKSELYQGINTLLRYLTWVIVPVGALLVVRQFTTGEGVSSAVVGSVAGLVPMIPEGLVLITSVAFAVGVIRLARRRCLVQELPAVEVLARVDTLCLDKTGTLTEPGLTLREIYQLPSETTPIGDALAALAAADPNPNPTLRAIAAAADDSPKWTITAAEPFSSARKYAGATFEGHGSWRLGAPDVLLAPDDPYREPAERFSEQGLRVLAVSTQECHGLVVLEQRVRATARPTLHYFDEQGVAVKVISGDNAESVGAIATAVGVVGADSVTVVGSADVVDARELPDGEKLATVLEEKTVFGRVTPQQKREFVQALQSRGHVVGMTGDGVNDALALRGADLGIAMGSGSAATRTVAKVVLLDDDFAVLPGVVGEGRRVLANIERVANLFLTKTVYSIVLAVLVGLAHIPFPFLPRHVTVVAALTIGIPSVFLALAPTNERAQPGFVPRVLRFAGPAGIVCAVATFAGYAFARANTAGGLEADRATATMTLFLVAFWALVLVARPLNGWKFVLLASLAGTFVALAAMPWTRRVLALPFGDLANDGIGLVCGVAGAVTLTLLTRNRHPRRGGGEREERACEPRNRERKA